VLAESGGAPDAAPAASLNQALGIAFTRVDEILKQDLAQTPAVAPEPAATGGDETDGILKSGIEILSCVKEKFGETG